MYTKKYYKYRLKIFTKEMYKMASLFYFLKTYFNVYIFIITAIRKPKITPALNEAELQKFSKQVWMEDVAFVIFQVPI